jgi:hypothetical protein
MTDWAAMDYMNGHASAYSDRTGDDVTVTYDATKHNGRDARSMALCHKGKRERLTLVKVSRDFVGGREAVIRTYVVLPALPK